MNRKLCFLLLLLIFLGSVPFGIQAAEPTTAPATEGLTLEKSLQLAFQNSPLLKIAARNVAGARAGVRQAWGAFGPSVDYLVSYTDDSDPYQMPTEEYYYGSLTLSQPLFTFGQLSAGLKLAKAQLALAQEDERKAKQDLTYNVINAYYGLWLAQQSLGVAQTAYDNLERHYQQMQHFYAAGTVSKYQLLFAKVQWEGLKPQLIKAQNGVALAKSSLAILIGLKRGQEFSAAYDPARLELVEPTLSEQALLDQAYQNRPEMRQAQLAIRLAKAQTQLARAGYFPVIAVQGGYQGFGTELNPDNWEKIYSLTLALSGSLFKSGATHAAVKAAKEGEAAAILQEAALRDQVQLELEQALQGLKESIETTQANQGQIDLARETLRMTQARFDAGMATTMDLMDSQLALDQALNGYYQGIFAYLTATAKLDLVIGRNQ